MLLHIKQYHILILKPKTKVTKYTQKKYYITTLQTIKVILI